MCVLVCLCQFSVQFLIELHFCLFRLLDFRTYNKLRNLTSVRRRRNSCIIWIMGDYWFSHVRHKEDDAMGTTTAKDLAISFYVFNILLIICLLKKQINKRLNLIMRLKDELHCLQSIWNFPWLMNWISFISTSGGEWNQVEICVLNMKMKSLHVELFY